MAESVRQNGERLNPAKRPIARATVAIVLILGVSTLQAGNEGSPKAADAWQIDAARLRRAWEDEYANLQWHIEHFTDQAPDRRRRLEAEVYHPEALIHPTDADPLDVILRRTRALAAYLTPKAPEKLAAPTAERERIAKAAEGASKDERRALYFEARKVQRRIALTNPLIDFDKVLCNRLQVEGGSHMCNQYLKGSRQDRVVVVSAPFAEETSARDLLANAVCENGEYEGKTLPPGAFLQPDLDFDGRRIAFAYERNLYVANTDGTGLRQLTFEGKDWDPCWLPNGRLVFVSLRRGGSGRCHTKPTFTMYGMKADGTDLFPISFHETNEWHPSVDNDGMLVYSRWDYVDRDSDIAHHIWFCYPDGRNPRAPHGNYPHPLTTIPEVSWYDNPGAGRGSRPWMEMNIRAIPGSQLYLGTAAPHHGRAFGSLVMIDPAAADDNIMSQLKRITPEVPFPEAEVHGLAGPYGPAWPLSEDVYLCGWDPRAFPTYWDITARRDRKTGEVNRHWYKRKEKGYPRAMDLYLLDKFGNAVFLFGFDDGTSCVDPMPLRPRPKPPVIPTATWQGERKGTEGHTRATISIADVYVSDMPWPEGTSIERLRIVQLFPCIESVGAPRTSAGEGSNVRMSLGTVPVEDDGSAYFQAPVGKAIYFQALDADGAAVHSMRSNTFVHPGENLSCVGCHEATDGPPPPRGQPKAFRRAPSMPEPEALGLEPISYYRHIKPVFEKSCIPCHRKAGKGPQDMSYDALAWRGKEYKDVRKQHTKDGGPRMLFYFHGTGNGAIGDAYAGGSRTIPGYVGARFSKLGRALLTNHRNKASEEDIRKVTLWLDLNSHEYGSYGKENHERERQGELIWPKYDATPQNPQGLELDRPTLPGHEAPAGGDAE